MHIFFNALMILLVIIDPVLSAVVFTGLTSRYNKKKLLITAVKATLVAFGVMMLFAVGGGFLINVFGISLSAFRIAGGLLLFSTTFKMLFGDNDPDIESSKPSDKHDIAVFPIAIPLLAGPGCMTAIILLVSQTKTITDSIMVLSAIAVSNVVVLICLLMASKIKMIFGKGGINIITRVLGVLLAAMSVQFIIDGILGLIR